LKKTINTDFSELKQNLYNYSQNAKNIKINCLNNCSKHKLNSVKQIKKYHNQLLFLITYADNEDVRIRAEKEMQRLSVLVKQLPKTKQILLVNSGIVNAETHGTYSLSFINWLLKNKPNSIQIHSFGNDGTHPKELLKHFLNEMEFEVISNDTLSKIKWLQLVSGFKKSSEQLNWLVTEFIKLPLTIGLKEQLFESLKLYVRIKTNDYAFSRSFGSIQIKNYYYHSNGILKKFNELELIHKKLPQQLKLTLTEKSKILNTAKTALLLLNRETDPITYGNPEDILVYNLEHGLTIALFCIKPELRYRGLRGARVRGARRRLPAQRRRVSIANPRLRQTHRVHVGVGLAGGGLCRTHGRLRRGLRGLCLRRGRLRLLAAAFPRHRPRACALCSLWLVHHRRRAFPERIHHRQDRSHRRAHRRGVRLRAPVHGVLGRIRSRRRRGPGPRLRAALVEVRRGAHLRLLRVQRLELGGVHRG
jgi:hypothetical protein